MELGEVLCIPNGEPLCNRCPVRKNCIAAKEHSTDRIPVRSPKKKRRIENRTLFVIRDGDRFLFRKRPAKGLLAGLYEFPGEEGFLTEKEALSFASRLGTEPLRIRTLPEAKHIFTHIEWHMHAWEIRVASFSGMDEILKKEFRFVTKKELQGFAVPSAFRTYVDHYALRD